MPVLASTDELIPRSALRYRSVGEDISSVAVPVARRASRPRADSVETSDDVTSGPPVTAQRPAQSPKRTLTKQGVVNQIHPLLYLGVGMLVMLILWMLLSALFGWVRTALDDLRYGRPRTFQVDAWVGHEQTGSPSHFIALNLHRHIEIIELPGGDAAHAHIYVGPQLFGAGGELAPVTLSFLDVNGDHRPDMIVSFADSRLVYLNDKGAFRPLLPSERSSVEQFLQSH